MTINRVEVYTPGAAAAAATFSSSARIRRGIRQHSNGCTGVRSAASPKLPIGRSHGHAHRLRGENANR